MYNRSIITLNPGSGILIPFFIISSLIMFISPMNGGAAGVSQGHVGNGQQKPITVLDFKYLSLQTPPGGYPEPAEPTPTPQLPVDSNSTGSYPPPSSTEMRLTPYPIESNNEASTGIPTLGLALTITPNVNSDPSTEISNPATEGSTLVSSGIVLWLGFLIGLAIFSAAVVGASRYSRRGR